MLFEGGRYTVYESPEAVETWKGLSENREKKFMACASQLELRMKKFADGHKLHSPEQIRDEGDGFFAFKARCGLRAYWWYSSKKRGAIVISHYIHKKSDKLDSRDKERMLSVRGKIEEKGDE